MEYSDAYVAGLLDGEGCIGVYTNKGPSLTIVVQVTNTYRPLLLQLSRQWGGVVNGPYNKVPGHKPVSAWQLKGPRLKEFLQTIRPFLVIKRRQAQLALQAIRHRESHDYRDGRRRRPIPARVLVYRRKLAAACKALNKRGL